MKHTPRQKPTNHHIFLGRGKIQLPPRPLRMNLTEKEIDKMIQEIRADHIDMKTKK